MKATRKERAEPLVTVERSILKARIDQNFLETVRDEVVVEHQTELYINDKIYAVFSCSPSQIKEMVVGYLIFEGKIKSPKEIMRLEVSKGRASVHLNREAEAGFSKKLRLVPPSCSRESPKIPPHLLMKDKKAKIVPTFKLNVQTVLEAMKVLNSQASVFRRTGGTHASALLDEGGRVLAFSEDVGRHNAVDKVVGIAALEGVDFTGTLLVSTGRLTSEMVVKAAIVEIPVMASLSAPTDKGIKIAGMTGITLIGFARGRRFNVYAWPERIVF
ncbi:MAG: formate dehydrogenase accessory sulfurtransferase FdhD [Candidatus Bathyarchaeota archaeon]|nr:formate dehydrogenase accessory sulfurtransferase FdhD [Candidatus Bathyarchaeota archaeon]